MKEQKNTYEYQVMRAIKRKYYLISLRGGKCQNCGYDKNMSALDFHHVNPETKKFQLDQRSLSNLSMKSIMNEFEKCEVLCANCHREHHSPDLLIENVLHIIQNFDEKKSKWLEIKKEKDYYCTECSCKISKWGTKCKNCHYASRRIVVRPNLNDLKKETEIHGYEWAGRKYKVSGKTIKKWLK